MSEESKKIEVVSGNGKNLEISDVSTHLNIAKPKIIDSSEKKQVIVIPKSKDNSEKDGETKKD